MINVAVSVSWGQASSAINVNTEILPSTNIISCSVYEFIGQPVDLLDIIKVDPDNQISVGRTACSQRGMAGKLLAGLMRHLKHHQRHGNHI